MRFGLIANFNRPDAAVTVQSVVDWCNKHNHEVHISDINRKVNEAGAPVVDLNEIRDISDVIISLGGDGTLLASARIIGNRGIPIIGINLGSLGFLTQLTPDQLENALNRVADKDYNINERLVLKCYMVDGPELELPYALNDIVIDKGDVSRVINLSLYAGNQYICSYTGDGLIIATPTGSTAYSLAVGGPILNPVMNAFIVSPISPFSLTSRPMVFPPDIEIEVRIRSEHGKALLTIDGQVATHFSPTGSIRITKADHTVKLISFEENSFYDVLRKKLHWGRLPVVDYKKSDLFKEDSDQ